MHAGITGHSVVRCRRGVCTRPGRTSRLVLDLHPASYTAIEGDEAAAAQVRSLLAGFNQKCLVGSASETGLPENSATVVYGEAMLTMQGPAQKRQIVQEAGRLLKPGGRYGVHELCLVPDDLDGSIKQEIQHALAQAIHVGARPLTSKEWRAVLEAEGFEVQTEVLRPMRLLKADRLIQDEGFWGRSAVCLESLSRPGSSSARLRNAPGFHEVSFASGGHRVGWRQDV